MSSPEITAVITTFNQKAFLSDAIESALQQHDCWAEIIVVDDGSDDGTADVAAAFGPGVHLIRTEHRGVAAARNLGWRSAHAELIAFLDGDDIWLREKLRTQADALAGMPEAGLAYSDTMRVRPDLAPIDRWGRHMRPVWGDALLPMLMENRVHTSTVVMRRHVLHELDGFDERLPGWEDIDLWTRTAVRYPYVYVPRVLAQYRMHGSGISHFVMDLAQGRLTSASRIIAGLPLGRLSPRDRNRVLARVSLQMAMAYYQLSKMRQARRWLVRSWATDPWCIVRGRSLETYLKSLAGQQIVESLRARIRPLKSKYSAMPSRGAVRS